MMTLSSSALSRSLPLLPQIPCCAHAAPPHSFPFCFAGWPSTVIPPLPHHRRAENCSLPQLQKSTPKSLAQCKHVQEVWLDGTRPWLFWLTLSFPDCSRLFLYLAVVVCVSMALLSVTAGTRAGSVAVVWGLGRRREHIAPEAAHEKGVLNLPGLARPSPRARSSMHRY